MHLDGLVAFILYFPIFYVNILLIKTIVIAKNVEDRAIAASRITLQKKIVMNTIAIVKCKIYAIWLALTVRRIVCNCIVMMEFSFSHFQRDVSALACKFLMKVWCLWFIVHVQLKKLFMFRTSVCMLRFNVKFIINQVNKPGRRLNIKRRPK